MENDQKEITEQPDLDGNEPGIMPVGAQPAELAVPDKQVDADNTDVGLPKKRISLSRKVILSITVFIVLISGAIATWFFGFKHKPVDTTQSNQQVSQEKHFGVAVGLIEGAAEYSSDTKTWQPLETETDLTEGQSVRTSDGGRVVLLIDDGSAVRLDAKSQLELTSLNVDNIVITNMSGELYSRVVASETRKFDVQVNSETYSARGTAYRTINDVSKKGVEVYHSSVGVVSKNLDVPEGSGFFTLNDQKSKENAVLALDLEVLKQDDFIKWNSEQDKKVAAYSDKLGVLTELEKPAPPPPTPKPAPVTTSSGIVLKGSQSEYTASFSWTVKNVDTSKGFKLVRSKKTTTPVYPENSVAYIEKGKTSYALYVGDGEAYHYRLCAYREGTCDSYSNSVTVATTKKPVPQLVPGTVTLSMNGSQANWTFTGTAPEGFKIVLGTTPGPTYSNNYKKYYASNTSVSILAADVSAGTTYYVRVCKYISGDCTDYSNEVTYTP